MTCIFLKPHRADTQGSVISSTPPSQTTQKEKEKYIHLYNSCVVLISMECIGFH